MDQKYVEKKWHCCAKGRGRKHSQAPGDSAQDEEPDHDRDAWEQHRPCPRRPALKRLRGHQPQMLHKNRREQGLSRSGLEGLCLHQDSEPRLQSLSLYQTECHQLHSHSWGPIRPATGWCCGKLDTWGGSQEKIACDGDLQRKDDSCKKWGQHLGSTQQLKRFYSWRRWAY